MLTRVLLRRHFDAAHQLPYHEGKCHQLHGHRYVVELVIAGEVHADRPDDPQSGMVVDFGKVKATLDAYLPDHRSLNLTDRMAPELAVIPAASQWPRALANPTAERLAERFAEDLAAPIAALGVRLVTVVVWETPEAAAVVDVP